MEIISTLKEVTVEEMDGLKESTNPQKNQAVLDNLGENADGQLTYKGEAIGTPNLHMEDVKLDYDEGVIHNYVPMVMTIECSLLPINARVRRIEIPNVLSETGEYFPLEDMAAKDTEYKQTAPYIITYPKNMQGDFFTVAAFVAFPVQTNKFYDMIDLGVYNDIPPIKIYYEIEE